MPSLAMCLICLLVVRGHCLYNSVAGIVWISNVVSVNKSSKMTDQKSHKTNFLLALANEEMKTNATENAGCTHEILNNKKF